MVLLVNLTRVPASGTGGPYIVLITRVRVEYGRIFSRAEGKCKYTSEMSGHITR